MNANKTLAAAVAVSTGFDADDVEAVINVHQSQMPGSWQNWTQAEMQPFVTEMMVSADKAGETSPARIVQYFGR